MKQKNCRHNGNKKNDDLQRMDPPFCRTNLVHQTLMLALFPPGPLCLPDPLTNLFFFFLQAVDLSPDKGRLLLHSFPLPLSFIQRLPDFFVYRLFLFLQTLDCLLGPEVSVAGGAAAGGIFFKRCRQRLIRPGLQLSDGYGVVIP